MNTPDYSNYSVISSSLYYKEILFNKKRNFFVLLILMTFVTCFSITDLIFSFSPNSFPCQTDPSTFGLTLQLWLMINGVFGLFYYLFFIIGMLVYYNNQESYIKVGISNFILTFFSLLWAISGVVTYIPYHSECIIIFFNVYMCIRLSVGVLSPMLIGWYSYQQIKIDYLY